MGRPKKSNNYIDNDELKQIVKEYIESNPSDNGQWLERYQATMSTRCRNNPKKWEEVKDFIEFRRRLYDSKRPFNNYQNVAKKLIPMLYKIIEGRMASYKIFGDNDVKQECMVSLLKYINRYDYRKDTSAFAYISEIVTQAINLYLAREKESRLDGNLVYEHELYDYRSTDEMAGFTETD
jgi:DNA-directed RNA polymerase specialized sigma subunit